MHPNAQGIRNGLCHSIQDWSHEQCGVDIGRVKVSRDVDLRFVNNQSQCQVHGSFQQVGRQSVT